MVPGHDGPHAWATLPPDPDPRDAEIARLRAELAATVERIATMAEERASHEVMDGLRPSEQGRTRVRRMYCAERFREFAEFLRAQNRARARENER